MSDQKATLVRSKIRWPFCKFLNLFGYRIAFHIQVHTVVVSNLVWCLLYVRFELVYYPFHLHSGLLVGVDRVEGFLLKYYKNAADSQVSEGLAEKSRMVGW